MDALRLRLRVALLEWGVAAAFLAATFAVGSADPPGLRAVASARRRLRRVPAPVAAIPAAVPPGAVSVPGAAVPGWQGDPRRRHGRSRAARLGRLPKAGGEEVDRGRLGERLTRFYEYAGFRFILVFEPFERNGEPRVAAIYLP